MSTDNLIHLKTFNNTAEATIIKNILSLQGIESYIEDENVMGFDPSAGVRLKVLESDVLIAKDILEKV